jgi:phage shock protein PspC (stress-responsive transcriptional regulator)
MKKNISINISGIIFHIEEDGYDTLRKYLDSINNYFGSFEDSSEILADIESRIAEIFLSRLNDGKQVVTAEDVQTLISTMGNVNDFKAAEEQEFVAGEPRQESKQQAYSASSGATTSKKLYRDERRKVLGGVCAGLAHYFNIDPVWPRLLFALLVFGSYGGLLILYIILWIVLPVSTDLEEEPTVKKMFRDSERKVVGGVAAGVAAFFGADITLIRVLFVGLTFLGGLGLILYVILWIALPEAKTITEKMKMQGEPVTLSNIESSVKKGLNEKDGQEESVAAKIILFPFRLIAMIITGAAKALGPIFKLSVDILRVMIGVFISLMGVMLMLGLILAFGVSVGLFNAPEWLMFGDWQMEGSNFPIEAFRNTFPTWMVVMGFLTGFIPCLFITLLGNSIIAKKIVFNAYVGWTLFVAFFVSIAFMGVAVPRLVYSFKEEGEYKVEKVFQMNGKIPVLKINEMGLDDYDVTDLNIHGYDGKELKLIERFEANGSTRKIAGENAQMVDYNVNQSDSVITFDSNIRFKPNAKFRAQRLDMELYIPYNTTFSVDENLWRLINFRGRHYRFDSENGDNLWKISETDELECVSCEKNSVVSSSGRSVKDQYGLADFNAVDLRGLFDVRIERGDQFAVEFNGPEDIKRHYRVAVDGETLVVEYDDKREFFWKRNFSRDPKLELKIIMPSLRELDVKGAGELKMRGFTEDEMDIDLMGAVVGEIQMDVRNLNINMTGATFLELNGSGDFMEADVTGASGLKAYGYEVERGVIEAHGASSAKVFVTERLEIKKGIASSVSHRGNPDIIRER